MSPKQISQVISNSLETLQEYPPNPEPARLESPIAQQRRMCLGSRLRLRLCWRRSEGMRLLMMSLGGWRVGGLRGPRSVLDPWLWSLRWCFFSVLNEVCCWCHPGTALLDERSGNRWIQNGSQMSLSWLNKNSDYYFPDVAESAHSHLRVLWCYWKWKVYWWGQLPVPDR